MNQRSTENKLQKTRIKRAQQYLVRYGFLKAGNFKSGVFGRTSIQALQVFQLFHQLPVTGVLNARTLGLMDVKRCGMPDMQTGFKFLSACRWDRKSFTYAFANPPSNLPAQQAVDAVQRAFATWAPQGPFTFDEVDPSQFPDFLVSWASSTDTDYPAMANPNTLAHADFPPDCSIISPATPKPLHLNESYAIWVVGASPGAFDIETVALHEIGHLLGLQHTNDPNAVMYPFCSPNATHHALEQSDVDAIRSLYS